jgi:hypothetical protein
MAPRPIPTRIPALKWRAPAFIWTPVALALAIGWPAALFYREPNLQRLVLVIGAGVFALALITLGASWAMGRAPKMRREVVSHVVIAGIVAALVAPFVLAQLLSAVSNYEHDGAGQAFTPAMSMAMMPLAFVLGLPIALVSGTLFAWIALAKPRVVEDLVGFNGVQPFR